MPVRQATVSRCLSICELIINVKGRLVKFPDTTEEYNSIKAEFFEKFNIRGTIGAIDCTHVALISPPSNHPRHPDHLYFNRKGFHSVNVEALYVNAQFPGSCHDSGIWSTSPIKVKLMQEHTGPQFKWLLGDSGYPLEPWLLTPLNCPTTNAEKLYNKVHIKARNCIERGFGFKRAFSMPVKESYPLLFSQTSH